MAFGRLAILRVPRLLANTAAQLQHIRRGIADIISLVTEWVHVRWNYGQFGIRRELGLAHSAIQQ